MRQHARGDSISKRAPSTTRTSLHFRINELRAARHQIIARRLRLPSVSRSYYDSAAYERACAPRRSNCVGPLNLVRSLTAFPRCRWIACRLRVRAHRCWRALCGSRLLLEAAGGLMSRSPQYRFIHLAAMPACALLISFCSSTSERSQGPTACEFAPAQTL